MKQPTNDLSNPKLIDNYVEKGSIVIWVRKQRNNQKNDQIFNCKQSIQRKEFLKLME